MTKQAYSFSNEGGLIIVRIEDPDRVTILDGPAFLLDTGSPVSLGYIPEEITGGLPIQGPRELGGFDLDTIGSHVGCHLDGLIGADVLGGRSFYVDFALKLITFDAFESKEKGTLIPLQFLSGIPMVEMQIQGESVRAFVDTGARISYAIDSLIGQTTPRIDLERDFYPPDYEFDVECFELKTNVPGRGEAEFTFGRLPEFLADKLALMQCEAILGMDWLRQFSNERGFRIDYLNHRLWLANGNNISLINEDAEVKEVAEEPPPTDEVVDLMWRVSPEGMREAQDRQFRVSKGRESYGPGKLSWLDEKWSKHPDEYSKGFVRILEQQFKYEKRQRIISGVGIGLMIAVGLAELFIFGFIYSAIKGVPMF